MAMRRTVWTVALLVGALVAAGCGPRNASLPRDTQTVDGMTIYVGVIPAELVRGHSIEPSDPKALHGATPKDSSSHHLVVALFDAKTGVWISDARIKAGIGDRSYNHESDKWLEPMQIDGTITYSNFFLMQGEDVWRIHLHIQRPGAARSSEAAFAYEHAPNP